eukprot:Sspe_Gene.67033::Locus_39574_Transcript_2_2_Confidence_0.667_Length_1043::g.67033::m.67033
MPYQADDDMIADDVDQLRLQYSKEPPERVLDELVRTATALRKAEAECSGLRKELTEVQQEKKQLQSAEKSFMSATALGNHANKISDINEELRRLIIRDTSSGLVDKVKEKYVADVEAHFNKLHKEIESRDETIHRMQDRIKELEIANREVSEAAHGGTAQLLTSQRHTDFLTHQLRQLTHVNEVMHSEILQHFRKVESMRPSRVGENIAKHLCTGCRARTVLWYDSVFRTHKELTDQLSTTQARAFHLATQLAEMEGLLGKYLAGGLPPTPTPEGGVVPHPIHPPTATSKCWSPRPSPPRHRPTCPTGYRLMG